MADVTVEESEFQVQPQVDGSILVGVEGGTTVVVAPETAETTVQPQVDGSILVTPVLEAEPLVLEMGIPGPPGPAAEPTEDRHVYEQATPSDNWLIEHGLGAYPSAILVVDTAGSVVITEVILVDLNNIRVLAGRPFSGKVYIRV